MSDLSKVLSGANGSQIQVDLNVAFSVLTVLYSLGQDISKPVEALFTLIVLGQPLSDAQRQALQTSHAALSSALQEPLTDDAVKAASPNPTSGS